MPGPIAALLPLAIDAIGTAVPALIRNFGSGSQMAERNAKAAELVVATAKKAANAVNEQELLEKMDDPSTAAVVKEAVQQRWHEIVELAEAGGGGIAGARAFAVQASSGPLGDAVWTILAAVTYAALAFLALANVIAIVAWGLSLWRDVGFESAQQLMTQVITADIGAAMAAIGFWLGSSWQSKRQSIDSQGKP
jgi:hypothetical protein